MVFDRALRDSQFGADLFVGIALHDQRQYLALADRNGVGFDLRYRLPIGVCRTAPVRTGRPLHPRRDARLSGCRPPEAAVYVGSQESKGECGGGQKSAATGLCANGDRVDGHDDPSAASYQGTRDGKPSGGRAARGAGTFDHSQLVPFSHAGTDAPEGVILTTGGLRLLFRLFRV